LALESAPNTIKELTESGEQAYDVYDVKKLAKVFVILQSVLVEVMRAEGGNTLDPPHMGKDKLQREGLLPMALPCDGELYRKTLQIIGGG
jgi:hypothetical protein